MGKQFTNILIFFLLIHFASGQSQIQFPDSLKTAKEKAIYLLETSKYISEIQETLNNTDEVIRISKEIKNDSLLTAAYFLKAFAHYNDGNMHQSMIYAKKSDSINNNIPHYNYSIPSLIANIHSFKGENEKAITSMTKAIYEAQKNNAPNVLVDAYSSISLLFSNGGYPEKAKTYNLKALEIIKQHPDFKDSFFKVYINLIIGSKTYEEVKIFSKEIEKKIDTYSKKYQAYYYVVLGDKLIKLNKFLKAKQYLEKGMLLCKETNYSSMLSIAETDLGIVYAKIGNYKKAIEILEKKKNETQENLEVERGIVYGLSIAYEGVNNYKKANLFLKKYVDINDSIASKSSRSKFAEFDAKFKAAEKDKEIAKQQLLLEKQKSAKNKVIAISLILLLLAYTLFQWFYNKQKRKKLITESELQKEQEINDLRTKFLGNIAHEIRTPLTLISGNLELAKENIKNKEKAIQNINVALTNSKKVVADANEILELLKFEKKKTTIKLNTVNLDITLKRIFFSFKSLAEFKNIQLDYQSNFTNELQAKIDVEKTEKILNNLISNAIKYSPSNSKIIFNATLKKSKLQIKITDFGQGIHFNETEKIFQRFYQASNSQSVGGIGIGLSLAKEFAELLGGTLTVTSKLKQGSTFTLTIPLNFNSDKILIDDNKNLELINRTDTLKNNTNKNIDDKKEKETSEKPHILVAEDNPEMNHYLVEILSEKYHCTPVFDGLEALEKLKTQRFDLITSDIMMPNLDGFQLREELNKNISYKNIPFILISAKTLPEDKIKGFQLGIDDYVIKPFDKNELIARINNLLEHKKSRENWISENKTLISSNESSDKKLLKKITSAVLKHIDNENFKVVDLAQKVGYSQRQLTRVLKQYTGMSPVKFILEIRLQKAYQNLQHKTFFSLSEVRFDVGINSSSYFNKKFKERFGISPNDLLK